MPKEPKYRELRLILGDQLNSLHSWFDGVDPDVLYVMMEIRPESELEAGIGKSARVGPLRESGLQTGPGGQNESSPALLPGK